MLSARIHETPLFDSEDIDNIIWCAHDMMQQWMNDGGIEAVSFNDIRQAVIMQIELHIEASANSAWPQRQKYPSAAS